MPLEYIDEDEDGNLIEEREPFTFGQAVTDTANVANELNYGIGQATGTAPLLQRAGIGINRPDAEGKVTTGQGALRMLGMAAPLTLGGLAPGAIRTATMSPVDEMIQAAWMKSQTPTTGIKSMTPMGRNFIEESAETMLRNPVRTGAVETTSALAAGAAGQAAENAGAEPGQRMVSELFAGALAAFGPAGGSWAVAKAQHLPGPQLARTIYKQIVKKAGADDPVAMRMAADRIERVVDTPVRELINQAEGANVLKGPEGEQLLSFASRGDDAGLLALEKAIIQSSEKLSEDYQKRLANVNQRMQEELGNIQEGATPIDTARTYLSELLDENISIAQDRVSVALDTAGPNISRADANIIARQELDKAYETAIKQKNEMYGNVDFGMGGPTDNTTQGYTAYLGDMLTNRNRAAGMKNEVPDFVVERLGKYNKKGKFKPGILNKDGTATLPELDSFRSDILQEIRAEKAKDAPNGRKLRFLGELQRNILADIDAITVDDPALRLARDYYKDMAQRFEQGNVGRVLGFEVTGEGTIPGIETLEQTVGRGGMKAASAVQDLFAATERTGDLPEMRRAVSEMLSEDFIARTQPGGQFNPKSAANYLNQNREVLKSFPELRRQFEQARETGVALAETVRRTDPNINRASVILKRNLGKEFDALVNSSDPRAGARQTMELLSSDPKAVEGWRNGFMNQMLDRVTRDMPLDTENRPLLSGPRLSRMMNDRAFKEVMEETLTPDQIGRLQRVTNTALRVHREQRTNPSKEILNASENLVSKYRRKLAGAAAGRWVGQATGNQGTVQLPGLGVSLFDQLADRGLDPGRMVLIDAITSPDDTLINALLVQPITRKQQEQVVRRLQAWTMATAQKYGIDMMSEEKPQQQSTGGLEYLPQ